MRWNERVCVFYFEDCAASRLREFDVRAMFGGVRVREATVVFRVCSTTDWTRCVWMRFLRDVVLWVSAHACSVYAWNRVCTHTESMLMLCVCLCLCLREIESDPVEENGSKRSVRCMSDRFNLKIVELKFNCVHGTDVVYEMFINYET